jgi:hypothetical protein
MFYAYRPRCVDVFSMEFFSINEWLTSLFQSDNTKFKCPTIGFTCKQRQLYSNNGQIDFSIPIETLVSSMDFSINCEIERIFFR